MDMDMGMDAAMTLVASTTAMAMGTATSTAAAASSTTTAAAMTMSMGGSPGCKLSMLLNWTTIDACFLFPTFHIHTTFVFFLTCLTSFLLVLSLEFIRRLQREFDRHLRTRKSVRQDKEYVLPEEMEEKLLEKDGEEVVGGGALVKTERKIVVMLEQILRGLIHMVQFSVSYCIMLLFMYSNGYIIASIILGALVGFALFTRDTLHSPNDEVDDRETPCC